MQLNNDKTCSGISKMLVHKEIDDLTAQKIICCGTILLLLFYLIKFVRSMSNRTYYLEDQQTAPRNDCLPVPTRPECPPPPTAPTCSRSIDHRDLEDREPKDRYRRSRRRRNQYIQEEWIPKSLYNHECK